MRRLAHNANAWELPSFGDYRRMQPLKPAKIISNTEEILRKAAETEDNESDEPVLGKTVAPTANTLVDEQT